MISVPTGAPSASATPQRSRRQPTVDPVLVAVRAPERPQHHFSGECAVGSMIVACISLRIPALFEELLPARALADLGADGGARVDIGIGPQDPHKPTIVAYFSRTWSALVN